MSATDQLLADRYGRGPLVARRRRVQALALGASLLLVFLVWAIAVNFFSGSGVSATTDSFSVIDANHSSVKFTVRNASIRGARCDITAANGEFQVVGFRTFFVPAESGSSRSFEATLSTTELPFSVTVQNCQNR